MRFNELHSKLTERVEHPAATEEIVEQCGDLEIEAPAGGTVTVQELLEADETNTYGSERELYDSMICNLDESHVGRKNYDDRGPNYGTEELSF